MFADDVKHMVQESCGGLDFVFMAACKSALAATMFLEAGA